MHCVDQRGMALSQLFGAFYINKKKSLNLHKLCTFTLTIKHAHTHTNKQFLYLFFNNLFKIEMNLNLLLEKCPCLKCDMSVTKFSL